MTQKNMIGVAAKQLNVEKLTIPNRLSGSSIATDESVKALLSYLPERSATLFVNEGAFEQQKSDLQRLSSLYAGNSSTQSILPGSEMPSALSENTFTAFHLPGFGVQRKVNYARSRFSKTLFPITSIAHGLSYHDLQYDLFENLLATPILPCDSVICTSLAARDAFHNRLRRVAEELGSESALRAADNLRTDVIPLGVDTDLYRPRDRGDARQLLGLPKDKIILLYFGRIESATKADPFPLLLAMKELANKYGDSVLLVFAGNGSEMEREHIRQTADRLGCARQVEIRLRPTVSEGPLYYSAADVFVSLVDTLTESFGISPLEAMASGIPAVVSDWSGYRETVRDGETGYHIPTFWADCNRNIDAVAPLVVWVEHHAAISQSIVVDSEALLHRLDLLVSNKDLRERMGMQARQHMLQNYTWKSIVTRMCDLWDDLGGIAKSLPIPAAIIHPETTHSFDDFKHFASAQILKSSRLEVTEFGRRSAKAKEPFQIHAMARYYIQPTVLTWIMRTAIVLQRLRQPLVVGTVCQNLAPRVKADEEVIVSNIMWLLKHGYLRVAAKESLAPTR